MAHIKATAQQINLIRRFAADLREFGDRVHGVSDTKLWKDLETTQLRSGLLEGKLRVLAYHYDSIGNYTVLLPNGEVKQLTYEEL